MNPRQAVQFLKTRTGAFLIFAVLCLVGYHIVRGFQSPGFGKKSPPLEDAKPASSPQTVQSITRDMTPFRPPKSRNAPRRRPHRSRPRHHPSRCRP